MLRGLEFELLPDELDGVGEHAGANVEGPFDEARLSRSFKPLNALHRKRLAAVVSCVRERSRGRAA